MNVGNGVNEGKGASVSVAIAEAIGVGDSVGNEVKVGVAGGLVAEGEVEVEINVEVGEAGSTVEVTGGVGVDDPRTVMLVPTYGMLVNAPLPCEMRAVQSMAVSPACKPCTVKVKTVPLVVARLPFLPAMAAIKLPPCGPKIVVAGSAPKRFVNVMLLASTRFALYAQVISALAYPSTGTLFKLTVTSAVSPTPTFGALTVVEIYGPDGAVLVAVGINVGVDEV